MTYNVFGGTLNLVLLYSLAYLLALFIINDAAPLSHYRQESARRSKKNEVQWVMFPEWLASLLSEFLSVL